MTILYSPFLRITLLVLSKINEFPSREDLILLQLQDGKADIVVTADELVALLPPRQGRYPNMLRHLENRVIGVAADVREAATGTVLSGNSTVRCTSIKYVMNYIEITPKNFKPGLTVSAYVRILLKCKLH